MEALKLPEEHTVKASSSFLTCFIAFSRDPKVGTHYHTIVSHNVDHLVRTLCYGICKYIFLKIFAINTLFIVVNLFIKWILLVCRYISAALFESFFWCFYISLSVLRRRPGQIFSKNSNWPKFSFTSTLSSTERRIRQESVKVSRPIAIFSI